MKRKPRHGVFESLLLFVLAGHALAVPPRVVETVPQPGALNVDPTLRAIVVTFDQPMQDGSWSWCGGGDTFPKIPDGQKPFYRDRRTAVLPVELLPEHHYALGINCPSARGFRSETGEPAEIFRLEFTTGSAAGAIPSAADSLAVQSLERLRELLERRYSYFERTGTDWDARFDEAHDWILAGSDAKEWARRVAVTLEPARDPHLSLRDPVSGESFPTYRRNVVPNANREAILSQVQRFTEPAGGVIAGRIGDVGYIAIDGWSASEEQAAALDGLMAFASGLDALVIDARMNGGGSETTARRFAQWFVYEPAVYSRNRYREPDAPGGWGPMYDRTIEPGPPGRHFDGRVALLQGTVCLSSNESFILMMTRSPRVTTFGAATGGSSGNPKAYGLPNGIELIAPSWEDYRPDGALLEGNGIEPDVPVPFEPGPGDPVLERALQRLQEE